MVLLPSADLISCEVNLLLTFENETKPVKLKSEGKKKRALPSAPVALRSGTLPEMTTLAPGTAACLLESTLT